MAGARNNFKPVCPAIIEFEAMGCMFCPEAVDDKLEYHAFRIVFEQTGFFERCGKRICFRFQFFVRKGITTIQKLRCRASSYPN